MKKNILNVSVILVMLPVSLGSSGKMGCNKAKCDSEKNSQFKQEETEEKKENMFNEKKEQTFQMNNIEIV